MNDLHEKKVKSNMVYRGKILNLRVDTVELPNGSISQREVVEYNGAVAVVAINEENEVLLVRQYRYPVDQILLEIPAGKMERDEDPLECAKRELLEETGYVAEEWRPVYSFFSTPGFTSEKLHTFLAEKLSYKGQQLDDDEFVQVFRTELGEALKMISRGEICDAKSIVGLLGARQIKIEQGE